MGFKVTTISVLKTPEVVLANANRYIADTTLAKVKLTDFDTIFFPGGTGVTTLNEKNAGKLISYVQKNCENKKILITSICAATGMLGK
jgi:putative intracellular protease/amidase